MRKLVLTVDEIRAEEGYEKHPNAALGSAPVNPALIAPWQAVMQSQQQGDFGAGGEPAAPGAGGSADGDFGGGTPGDFGKGDGPAGPGEIAGDFGEASDTGEDFGKAMPLVLEVAL